MLKDRQRDFYVRLFGRGDAVGTSRARVHDKAHGKGQRDRGGGEIAQAVVAQGPAAGGSGVGTEIAGIARVFVKRVVRKAKLPSAKRSVVSSAQSLVLKRT